MRDSFSIAGETVPAGGAQIVQVPVPRLNSAEQASMPVHVRHSKTDGPRLFVSAAVHGDELNGVEIVRRLLDHRALKRLRGTLVAVPVVNVYGLVHASRYLPDRRDLNRSFPGSQRGSLTSRVAHVFTSEVVKRCTHGIDLHTGAVHRTNLPQIRANLEDPEIDRLARAFGVPVVLNHPTLDGSLRECAAKEGLPILLYEAGEALRYDEMAIRVGVQGILGVMRALDMLPAKTAKKEKAEPFVADSSAWVRAPETGMLRTLVPLGARVQKEELLGIIDDPYSGDQYPIHATAPGVVIGRAQSPLMHEGDAVYHVAHFRGASAAVEEGVGQFHDDVGAPSFTNELEIV